MEVYGVITGTIMGRNTVNGALSSGAVLGASLTIPTATGIVEYGGEYEFTPTEAEQIIEIAEQKASQNITINPIPSNYGLITYNGSTITVS